MSLADKLKKEIGEGPLTPTWKLRPEVLCGANIPKPMHGMAPRVVLGDTWWDKERRAAYHSTNQHCIACGVHRDKAPTSIRGKHWLEGHEIYDIDYLMGRMVYVETVPLCHYCHNYIHDGRLKMLLDSGKLSQSKYAKIIQHGDRILSVNQLEKKRYSGETADWSDWRLIIGNDQYPPLYMTYEAWAEVHRR